MMLQACATQSPVAGRIVQFSGGEPTIYPHFLEAVRMAKEMGFSHMQIATNGIRSPTSISPSSARKPACTRCTCSFDGVTDDVYLRTRGEALREKKLQVHRERARRPS